MTYNKTAAPENATEHNEYMFLRYSLYESFYEKNKEHNEKDSYREYLKNIYSLCSVAFSGAAVLL